MAVSRSTGAASKILREGDLSLEERRRLFIRVGIEDDPESIKLIPRFRCTEANLSDIFDKEIIFLQEDGTGRVIWPKDWAAECLQPPTLYFARERYFPELHPDELESDEYRGTVQVFAVNVPEEADKEALTAWIAAGLLEDDPEHVAAKLELEGKMESLVRAKTTLENLPREKIQTSNLAMEMEMKRKRSAALLAKIERLNADINRLEIYLGKVKASSSSAETAHFQAELVEVKKPLGLGRWAIKFPDNDGGRRMAFIAAHKMDWPELRLAIHKYKSKEPITKRGQWPTEDDEPPRGYQEISMRGVELQRLRHGTGMYRYKDERGVYSGGWRQNMRHGLGVEMNAQGRYTGRFERGFRDGGGTAVFANGDVARGEWSSGIRTRDRQSLLQGDEYKDGVLHGPARIRFVDGSEFYGQFSKGVPDGMGRLIDASGAVIQGRFGGFGTPHGPVATEAGDLTTSGTYRHGLLHGKGFSIDYGSGRYRGTYRHGLRHGYGQYETPIVDGRYGGMWQYGFRMGRGVFNWGNYKRDEKILAARKEKMQNAVNNVKGADRAAARRAALEDSKDEEHTAARAALAGAAVHRETPSRQAERDETDDVVPAARWAGGSAGRAALTRTADLRETLAEMMAGDSVGMGSQGLPGLPSFRLGTQVRKKRDLLKEAVQEQRRKAATIIRSTGLRDVVMHTELDPAEQVKRLAKLADDDDTKRESEYTKFESGESLGYLGDYMYEGRWRAGKMRIEGCFTTRMGAPQPHLHGRWMTNNGSNPRIPGMFDIVEREEELARGRTHAVRVTAAEILNRRRQKEADNLHSFEFWRKASLRNLREIRLRNRELNADVRTVRARLAAGDQEFRQGMAKSVGIDVSDNTGEGEDDEMGDTTKQNKAGLKAAAPTTSRPGTATEATKIPTVDRTTSGLQRDDTITSRGASSPSLLRPISPFKLFDSTRDGEIPTPKPAEDDWSKPAHEEAAYREDDNFGYGKD